MQISLQLLYTKVQISHLCISPWRHRYHYIPEGADIALKVQILPSLSGAGCPLPPTLSGGKALPFCPISEGADIALYTKVQISLQILYTKLDWNTHKICRSEFRVTHNILLLFTGNYLNTIIFQLHFLDSFTNWRMLIF